MWTSIYVIVSFTEVGEVEEEETVPVYYDLVIVWWNSRTSLFENVIQKRPYRAQEKRNGGG